MISYISSIITVLSLIYVGIIFESTALVLLGFVTALFVVLSFVYILRRRRHITGSISIPIALAQLNRPTKLNIEIYNSTRIKASKLRVLVSYGNKNTARFKSRWIDIKDARPGKTVYPREITMSKAGSFYYEVKKIRIYDLTGFFYINKRIRVGESAMVLPEINTVSVKLSEAVKNFFGDADTYDDLRSGYDPSETFEIRDYRPGDKLQSVHWKLSAKMDELVVRENSMPKACPVVIMLDPSGCNNKTVGAFYEWAAALSFTLLDAKCPHYVAWRSNSNKDIVRTRVDDEESFYFFLTQFMVDCEKNVNDDYCEKYRREVFLHKVILFGDCHIEVDGNSMGYPKYDNFELIL